MTALPRYQLLEAVGFYVERPGAPSVEVLLSFGDASLVIQSFDETPLAHWPLGSLVEERGAAPMTLAPDVDAAERLTIADPEMIAALRAMRPVVVGGPAPRWPRRRLVRLAALMAALAAAGAMLTQGPPLALAALAARTPPALRAALGDAAIAAYAGATLCEAGPGRRALDRLALAFAPVLGAPPVLRVARLARADAAVALPAPGGRILIPHATLAAAPSGAALTQAIAQALAEARRDDPLAAALRDAGPRSVLAAFGAPGPSPALIEAATRNLEAPREGPPPSAPRAGPEATVSASDWRAIKAICG